jgi:hypothetical protein
MRALLLPKDMAPRAAGAALHLAHEENTSCSVKSPWIKSTPGSASMGRISEAMTRP